jgi:hypothetical protein
MSKAITDIYGFAQEIQRQFGCDREVIEALVERFSQDIVIAADAHDAAIAVLDIAGIPGYPTFDRHGLASSLAESFGSDFDRILEAYRDTDWCDAGYTYGSLRDAVLQVWTEEECVEIVKTVSLRSV